MTYSEQFLKWWAAKGVSEDVLKAEGIRFEQYNGVNAIAIPCKSNGSEVYVKYITANKIEAYSSDPIAMYGIDSIASGEPMHMVQNELDRLLLLSSGVRNVVAFPMNMARWKENLQAIKPFIEQSNGVCLVFNKDEAGILYEEKVSEVIGIHKCYNVQYDEGCVTVIDHYKKAGHKGVMSSLEHKKHIPISYVNDFTDYEDDIIEYYQKGEARGLSTGYDNLNNLWTHQPGSMNIITGIPSSGKSEMVDALALNTIRLHGWKWVFYSPENMPAQFHFQKLVEKYDGRAMFGEDRMGLGDLKTSIHRLSQNIKIITPQENSLNLDEILLKAKMCKYRWKINGLVIDPYNECEHTRPDGMSETEYVSLFLGKIRHFSRINEVETFIVAHPTKLQKEDNGQYPVPTPYDISGSSNWRNRADNCFAVWRKYIDNPDNEVELHVQKVRNKNIGQVGVCKYRWNKYNGRFNEWA